MKSYNKNDLAIIANKTDFQRDQLEKVIRLTNILQAFHNNDVLSKSLILKGGTAINLTLFDLPRLSVDIDLDYCKDVDRSTMIEDRRIVTENIQSIMLTDGYKLNPRTKSPHSLDSLVYEYTNTGGNKDVIKIETNYSMRCHLFPPEYKQVNIEYLDTVNVTTMHPIELYGGKIKAMIERGACRDIYDINSMLCANLFSSKQERELLRKVVLFYMCAGGSTKPSVNIDYSKIEKIKFPQIRAQLLPVLKKSEKFDFETAKERTLSYLRSLLTFTTEEQTFVDKFNSGKYIPELLFDDIDIVQRITNHPMALWKTVHNKF